MLVHPREYTFVSGAADNLKKWKCPEGRFLHNLSGRRRTTTPSSTASPSTRTTLVSGADNARSTLGLEVRAQPQTVETVAQPGSLESEGSTRAPSTSRSRLITGEADKTIKVWGGPRRHPRLPPRRLGAAARRKKY